MKILHVLASGNIGGIEILCKDIAEKSKVDNTFLFLWRGGEIQQEIQLMGFSTIIPGIDRTISFDIIRAFNILCETLDEGFDTVVFHHSAPLMWAMIPLIRKRYRNQKILIYAHNHYSNLVCEGTKQYWIRKFLFSKACKCADGLIAISNTVKASIEEQGVKTKQIFVVYNGVNTSKFENLRSDTDTCNIIYVGRVTKQKGVDVLLEAVAQMKSAPFKVNIVGDGPYYKSAVELKNRLDISEKVEFLGFRRDIPELLKNANIFVHPAVWEEGFGIAIVEAMAAGLVVVASKKGAIPEIITEDYDGFMFEAGNSNSLALLLDKLVEGFQTAYLNEISYNAVNRAKDFSIENMVSSFEDCVREIVKT